MGPHRLPQPLLHRRGEQIAMGPKSWISFLLQIKALGIRVRIIIKGSIA
jgi:hypothetical protein